MSTFTTHNQQKRNKMKEVTDEDIEIFIDAHEVDDIILRKALRMGAKAMRGGLIKHIKS